jgi:hypothetical protein
MDIQALKLDLVEKILKTNKSALLIKIDNIFSIESEKDWWDELPHEIQHSIIKGIDDVKYGKVYTHDEIMQEAKQKYGL